jgi:hypothetical protein
VGTTLRFMKVAVVSSFVLASCSTNTQHEPAHHDSLLSHAAYLTCVYRGVAYAEGAKICITREHSQLCHNMGTAEHPTMVWADAAGHEGAQDIDVGCQGSSADVTLPRGGTPRTPADYCVYGDQPFSQGARICVAAQSAQRCVDRGGEKPPLAWGSSPTATGSSEHDSGCPGYPR